MFKCNYKNKKDNKCIGINFESEFSKLFSKNINYDNVYSDGMMNTWCVFENENYIFKKYSDCSENRMSKDHQLRLISIDNSELLFKASFINNRNGKIENRDFRLIMEDGNWKIKSAFYYDIF